MSLILKHASPLLVIAALLFPQQTTVPTLDKVDYDVYSTVIRSLSPNLRNSPFLIKTHTELVAPAKLITLQHLPEDARADFLEKNRQSVTLQEQFSLPVAYHLTNEDKVGGYGFLVIGLSRIGFNRAKDKALVYITYNLDTMDGQNAKERFFVVNKAGDQWVVQGTVGVIKRITE